VTISLDRVRRLWTQLAVSIESGTAVDVVNSDIATALSAATGTPVADLRFQIKRYRVYGPIAGATGAANLTVIDSTAGKAFIDSGSFSDRAKVGVVYNRVNSETIRSSNGTAVCNISCAPDGDCLFQAQLVVW
jgi:hypothetical protein